MFVLLLIVGVLVHLRRVRRRRAFIRGALEAQTIGPASGAGEHMYGHMSRHMSLHMAYANAAAGLFMTSRIRQVA